MAIKLLLIDDVEDLGRSGDIVSVKPGYARNFLMPKGLGVMADKNALRMQTRLQDERRKKAIEDKNESEALASRFEGVALVKIVKVAHDGHMYGSVSTLDIAHMLQEQAGITVEKRAVQLKHPIKEIGEFAINVKLKEGVTTSFKLTIAPEEVQGAASTKEAPKEKSAAA